MDLCAQTHISLFCFLCFVLTASASLPHTLLQRRKFMSDWSVWLLCLCYYHTAAATVPAPVAVAFAVIIVAFHSSFFFFFFCLAPFCIRI